VNEAQVERMNERIVDSVNGFHDGIIEEIKGAVSEGEEVNITKQMNGNVLIALASALKTEDVDIISDAADLIAELLSYTITSTVKVDIRYNSSESIHTGVYVSMAGE